MAESNDHRVSALAIGEFGADRWLLHEVFSKPGWRLFEARDRRHSMRILEQSPVEVVLAECGLPTWGWRKVLSDLRRLPHAPQLIVTSRTADDYLWAEVLNIGGYDVLPQPLAREEVERVVAAAARQFHAPKRHPATPVISPATIVA